MNYRTTKSAREFAERIDGTAPELMRIVKTLKGEPVHIHHVKECCLMTESFIQYPSADKTYRWENLLHIRSTENNKSTDHLYSLGTVNPYTAETALFLGLPAAKLALKPESANKHLADFGVGEKELDLYQDLGMSTQDAAHSIRMAHQVAQSGENDSQASNDYLASLDGDVFAQDDRGMSL